MGFGHLEHHVELQQEDGLLRFWVDDRGHLAQGDLRIWHEGRPRVDDAHAAGLVTNQNGGRRLGPLTSSPAICPAGAPGSRPRRCAAIPHRGRHVPAIAAGVALGPNAFVRPKGALDEQSPEGVTKWRNSTKRTTLVGTVTVATLIRSR